MRDIRLSDRFDLACSPVILNGTQALVRLMLVQRARDAVAGLNTAGYVTGYRGSPLGAVDFQMQRASAVLTESSILFRTALNEDLAATALWGAQQAELRGEGTHDGVFGLWYGKGPGVDRSGDALRHANMAGTSRFGGVLMALGDDHTGESSTTLHQSDWALVDAYVPVLSPAGVQEILDYGILGFALSRFSGNWVGLKCMKETVEATSVVDGRPDRVELVEPEFEMPPGGLNIRTWDSPREREARIIEFRRPTAEAFGRANRIDRRMAGQTGARVGFIAAGKNWLDLVHALDLLGLDSAECLRLGISTYKVGMTWPLDTRSLLEWAKGLELIVVVEEKRKLIETQVREALFDVRGNLRILGRRDTKGETLFPTSYALDPILIARKSGRILADEGLATDRMLAALETLSRDDDRHNAGNITSRIPYFCSGCPHNSSTRVPDGSRAYAGIGCHYMVQWMDRDTTGFTHMGGEGANWIGEAPFSRRNHVFQNMGDGTYNHSGLMAIRAAVAANVNVTFKLLFNDAVAMTGGQLNDGGLSAARMAAEVEAMGVRKLAVVYDEKESIDLGAFPGSAERHERANLDAVQRRFREIEGVTAIVYVQTCAAEKRRRRKRGTLPDPDRRVFIDSDVCEGCGDCGIQSNCVSIVPLETPLGRKRAIDQSSCNKDFSCLNGFCPSFVTVEGAKPRVAPGESVEFGELDEPSLPGIHGTYNLVIAGVGGTGVVTIGAILAMSAYLDGKGVGMIEMAGLAQKGGAVTIHCRIADKPEDISAIRVATGEADCILGGEVVVSAGSDVLGLMKVGRTMAFVNSHEVMTGEFTRNSEFSIPTDRLQQRIQVAVGAERLRTFDATSLAESVMGDSLYSNMIVLGAAWQAGALPVSIDALERAIELNGTLVESNSRAFNLGRWAFANPAHASSRVKLASVKSSSDTRSSLEFRTDHLREHSGDKTAEEFAEFVGSFEDGELREAVCRGYHKLLAVKDEYEVARLLLDTPRKVAREFEDGARISFHLAPPILGGKGPDGRPVKRRFGPWILGLFKLLSRMRALRGTPLDIFGRSRERRVQKALLEQYRADMRRVRASEQLASTHEALELASLPLRIKGFGPVWKANHESAMQRRAEILASLRLQEESDEDRADCDASLTSS